MSSIDNLLRSFNNDLYGNTPELHDIYNKIYDSNILHGIEYEFLIKCINTNCVNIKDYNRLKKIINKLLKSDLKDEIIKHLSDVDIIKKTYGNTFFDDAYIKNFVYNSHKDVGFIFNDNQMDAIDNILNHLKSKDKLYLLNGYAGTGKSTIIIKLIVFLLKYGYLSSVVLTAPTNKASNILKSKFQDEVNNLVNYIYESENKDYSFEDGLQMLKKKNINIAFTTIHQLLNYKQLYDNEGNKLFVKVKASDIGKYDLVIIDECSMLSKKIIKDIYDDIMIKKNNYKIVFVGDPAQLPPVNEKNSMLFCVEINKDKNDDDFHKYVANINSYTLTKIMRTSVPNIIGICTNVRNWLFALEKPTPQKFVGKGVVLYNGKSKKGRRSWIKNYVKNVSNNDNYSNIILTWTNRQGKIYNEHIRSELFDNPDKYQIKDILILTDFYSAKSYDKSIKESIRFHTSEQVQILNIRVLNKFKLSKFSNVIHQNLDNYSKKYKALIDTINASYEKVKVYEILVTKLNNDDYNVYNNVGKIYIIHEDSMDDITSLKNNISCSINNYKKQINISYPSMVERFNEHVIQPLWKEYNEILNNKFANVGYGYSITVHKSQGSTYYNVFIDMKDIGLNMNINEMKRCAYTAMSRTSNQLHVLL